MKPPRFLTGVALALTVVAFESGLQGAARADDLEAAEKTVTEELLDILLEAGTIDDARYQSLKARARREEQRRVDAAVEQATRAAAETPDTGEPATAVARASAPQPEEWSFYWKEGFRLSRDDGAVQLKFGGRIQNDWAFIDAADDVDRALGVDGQGVEFRRARIFFEGDLWEHSFFKFQLDFANTGDGTVELKDAYMGLRGLGPVGTVSVGHFKEPFSIEHHTSSKYLTFMERSLDSAFSPARNTGVMAFNTALDRRLLWQVGAFKQTNTSGFGFDDDYGWDVSGRLVGVPLYEEDGRRLVHLGLAYSHRFSDHDDLMRFSARPESHLAPRFVDTGSTIPADGVDLIAPELAVGWGSAAFQAGYVHAFVDTHGSPDVNLWGSYAQASFFLTGENRNYLLGAGRFGRVRPNTPFNPARGEWGAWEIAARFSYIDLNDSFVDGGEMWAMTAGLNWYPYSNARVLLNYVHASLSERTALGPPVIEGVDGDADIAELRFQVDF
jgi:phosphate-selective porin OprO/OprP